jgi:hypothetical protein
MLKNAFMGTFANKLRRGERTSSEFIFMVLQNGKIGNIRRTTLFFQKGKHL